MAKFSEETFNSWRMPPSVSEEGKLQNAEKLVSEAICENEALKKFSIDIFGQGSYANDTNVRLNSDIDINVRLSNTIFVQLPEGKSDSDFGYTDSSYTFKELIIGAKFQPMYHRSKEGNKTILDCRVSVMPNDAKSKMTIAVNTDHGCLNAQVRNPAYLR